MNPHSASILDYYDATRWDYRLLWSGARHMAVHFGYYDAQARRHADAVVRMNAVLADEVSITAGDRVLDAGCGYGGSSAWLAQHRGCRVSGVTLVPFQAETGMRRLRRLGLADRAQLMHADYSQMPFAQHSFEVYWALESLVHAEDRRAVLDEARRTLVPGGRIVVAEYLRQDDPPQASEAERAMQHWLDAWSMPRLLNAAEYRQHLQDAGFEQIEYRDISTHVRPSLLRLQRLCRLALPGAQLLRALGFFSARRVANITGSLCQIDAFERGLWRYGLLSARRI